MKSRPPRPARPVRRIHATAPSLKWYGWTDCGKIRPHNEDSFIGLQFNAHEVHHLGKIGEAPMAEHEFAFAVSDGMGGANAGEFASQIAVEKITELLPRVSISPPAAGRPVLPRSSKNCSSKSTGRSFIWAAATRNARDADDPQPLLVYSGLDVFRPHRRHPDLPADGRETLKQLSHDDTHVGWLLRNGHISGA